MDDVSESSRRFVPRFLPWIIAAVGLVLYLGTLCGSINHLNLDTISQLGGWMWELPWGLPLTYALAYPFKLVSEPQYPLALNIFTAVLAAITVAMLARS